MPGTIPPNACPPIVLAAPLAPRAFTLSDPARGLCYGMLGVLCFSLTPVETRAALRGGIDPLLLGTARPFGAALLGGLALLLTRQRWPDRAALGSLVVVAMGLGVVFPLLTAWVMLSVPAAHVATIFGLLPLATAIAGALRAGDRPSGLFWLCGVTGSGVVVAFALHGSGGRLEAADWVLFATVITTAISYAEGALLSRRLGGWQVISWALVLALPVNGSLLAGVLLARHGEVWRQAAGGMVSVAAWVGFGYVTAVSQWLGFFPWYRGLALGGIARVSQLQLVMPFLTIFAAALLLGERLTAATLLTALAVLLIVALGRCAPVRAKTTTERGL